VGAADGEVFVEQDFRSAHGAFLQCGMRLRSTGSVWFMPPAGDSRLAGWSSSRAPARPAGAAAEGGGKDRGGGGLSV
jgi:hypothetical protein